MIDLTFNIILYIYYYIYYSSHDIVNVYSFNFFILLLMTKVFKRFCSEKLVNRFFLFLFRTILIKK